MTDLVWRLTTATTEMNPSSPRMSRSLIDSVMSPTIEPSTKM